MSLSTPISFSSLPADGKVIDSSLFEGGVPTSEVPRAQDPHVGPGKTLSTMSSRHDNQPCGVPGCLMLTALCDDRESSTSLVILAFLYGNDNLVKTLINYKFPADSWDVRPHITADPSSEDLLCLDQAHNGHYVSEPYGKSADLPLNGLFSSGRYFNLEDYYPVSPCTLYRARSHHSSNTTMYSQAYQSPDVHPYGNMDNASQHYIADSDTYSGPALEFSQPSPPHLPVTAGYAHEQSTSLLPHLSAHADGGYAHSNAGLNPEAPALDPFFYGEGGTMLPDDADASRLWRSCPANAGPRRSPDLYDISVGYRRLQSHRPAHELFYQPDPRYTYDVHAGPRPAEPKKQTLACLFCRERKIACGRPTPGSQDPTCNQCARRSLKCEYPTESRRGQHKRKMQRHRVSTN